MGILAAATYLAVGALFALLFPKIVGSLASRTKTDVDDEIIKHTSRPVSLAIFLFFAYLGVLQVLPDPSVHFWATLVGILVGGIAIKRVLLDVFFIRALRTISGEDAVKRIAVLRKTLDVIAYTVIVLTALSFAGVDVWPIIAPLGVGGVALAFGVKDVVSNYVAGILLVVDKSLKAGERITVKEKGVEGRIKEIGWRSTVIETDDGKEVLIPNSTMINSTIIRGGS